MSFHLPKGLLDQHVIALGKTGSGKSSKLRVLVEGLLDREEPVCIVDVKGDWWGLKSSADGKRAGYPVVILGGKHADIPLSAHAGKDVAELIFTGNRPCIIDIRSFMPGERTRFFIDFASTAFKVTTGKRFLVIAEVHNFAFKSKVLSPQAGEMLYWANRLASEGRGLGLTILADSQRPQKVHNDFLTSCETLIACKVHHKADRDAVKDWVDGCADPAIGKEVIATLAQLKKPEAWVWSPEIEYGPERTTFPLFKTYDSFKPQEANTVTLKGWADVDLSEVTARLATVVEEAKANDPAILKRRIAELEHAARHHGNLAALKPRIDPDALEDAKTAAYNHGHKNGFVEACERVQDQVAGAIEASAKARVLLDNLHSNLTAKIKEAKSRPGPRVVTPLKTTWPSDGAPPLRETLSGPGTTKMIFGPGTAHMKVETNASPTVRKILDAIHRSYPVSLSFDSAARRVGVSSKSSAYGKYRADVAQSEEIETTDGKYRSRPGYAASQPMTGQDGLSAWLGKLPASYGKMLSAIYSAGPIDKDQIAEMSGVSKTSSGLGTGLRELISLELVKESNGLYEVEEGLR